MGSMRVWQIGAYLGGSGTSWVSGLSSGSAYPMRWREFSRQHPRAQAPFDCAHRRLRADVLRSGCLRLLCALPRTRRFWLPFPLEAVRNSG